MANAVAPDATEDRINDFWTKSGAADRWGISTRKSGTAGEDKQYEVHTVLSLPNFTHLFNSSDFAFNLVNKNLRLWSSLFGPGSSNPQWAALKDTRERFVGDRCVVPVRRAVVVFLTLTQ